MDRTLVAVDFECLFPNKWTTFAVVVFTYNTQAKCTVLHSATIGHGDDQNDFEQACNRRCETVRHAAAFWARHREAYEYNRAVNGTFPRQQAEREIVKQIEFIRTTWSDFYLICDNPAMDIRLLDNILLQHGANPISIRPPNNRFLQVICAWSYRLAVTNLLRISKSQFRDQVSRKVEALLARNPTVRREIRTPHTPLYDCIVIICGYLYLNERVTHVQPSTSTRPAVL